MKFAFTMLLIISFFGIAVLGAFAMAHNMSGMDHARGGCIAATAKGEWCPEESNALLSLTYHIDSFKSFSTATISDNLANLLILIFAITLIAGFWVFSKIQQALPILVTGNTQRRHLEPQAFLFQPKLTHWLSLHQNSPPSLF